MPKKNNELKVKAKQLYEEGFSLVDIAQQLNINAGTVRGWKSKDKKNGNEWNAAKKENVSKNVPKRSVPEASLANLDPIEPGEKRALKHGFYADNSKSANYQAYYQQALNAPINESSREMYAKSFANAMVAMENVNPANAAHIEAMARTGVMVTNMGEKTSKIEMTELNIQEKRNHLSGNDPALETVKEYTESFNRMANAYVKAANTDKETD